MFAAQVGISVAALAFGCADHGLKGSEVEACEVAKPAYGNDLASCLVVFAHWAPAPASEVGAWYQRRTAFFAGDSFGRSVTRRYLSASRSQLASAPVDSMWLARRLKADSTSAALFDSIGRAAEAGAAAMATRDQEYRAWMRRRTSECYNLSGDSEACNAEWETRWRALHRLSLDSLTELEHALSKCYREAGPGGYAVDRMRVCDGRLLPT